MVLYGTAYRVGDDITTDQIIDGAFQDADDPAILAAQCLAAVDLELAERVQEGDFLLAGRNFGAGTATEQAVLALQAVGFVAVVCSSAATSFVEIAHAYGLPVLICPDAATVIASGTIVRIDLERGTIEDRSTHTMYHAPLSPHDLIAAVQRVQLLTRMRRIVEEEGFDG